jgi:hypothetical protein
MIRPIRPLAGLALLAITFAFAAGGADRRASADEPKEVKKDEKKIELPKLPEGSKPKWDFEALEEKFTIVKGGINDKGSVYFLLELKQDMTSTPRFDVIFLDSDGVKFYKTVASCDPSNGKKGDRVRLIFIGAAPASAKETWIKAVAVRFSTD